MKNDVQKDEQNSLNPEDLLKLSDEIRRFEITHFWTRSLFFAGILAATFSGIQNGNQDNANDDPRTHLLLWCFGLICALAWSLANRGGKYWQEIWEDYGLDCRKMKSSSSNDSNPGIRTCLSWKGIRYSPSKLAMAVSDSAVLLWICLGVIKWHESVIANMSKLWCFNAGVIIVTVLWCVRMLVDGRGKDKEKESGGNDKKDSAK